MNHRPMPHNIALGQRGHMEEPYKLQDNRFITTMCDCRQVTNKYHKNSHKRKPNKRTKIRFKSMGEMSVQDNVSREDNMSSQLTALAKETEEVNRLTAYTELKHYGKTSLDYADLPKANSNSHKLSCPCRPINLALCESAQSYPKESALCESIIKSSSSSTSTSKPFCRQCALSKSNINMTPGPSDCCSRLFANAGSYNLLQRLVVPLVWHLTASSVIALLATLCYCLAYAQGVMATTLASRTVEQMMTPAMSSASTPLTGLVTLASHLEGAMNNNNAMMANRNSQRSGNKRLYGKSSPSTTATLYPSSMNYSSSSSGSNSDIDMPIKKDTIGANIIWTTSINTTTEMTILNDVSASLPISSSSATSVYVGHTSPRPTSTPATWYPFNGVDVSLAPALNESNSQNSSHLDDGFGMSGLDDGEAFDDMEDVKDPKDYIFDRTDVRIIFITLYTMVFCCCFFGNLLVILVVTLSRRLRSITNFFLANLALADFCVGVFCVMQTLSLYLIDSWVFGEFLCRMYQFVQSLSYTASIFILVVICMERYFAIVHPITCKQILTAARLRMVILTVWITSAVYSTPKFVFSKTVINVYKEGGREEVICVLDRKMFNSKLLDMINFGLLYVIPLLVMTVLYSKIAIALWRSSRGLSHHLAQQENSMGLHNSMYHHHQHHHHHQNHLLHNSGHHHHPNNHPSSTSQQHTGLGTPISAGSVTSSTLSRKGSSKYEKRRVDISESQVSLDADRPVVSACRKPSFFQHHNHLAHHQQQQQQQQQQHHNQTTALTSGNHHRSHLHHNHGSHHGGSGMHGSQRVSHISHSSNNVLRARRGVVRMLIIFVLTFALCNLPCHARKMWQYWSHSYRGDSNFNALLTPLTFLVTYFNSGINPLLYAFLSRNFRKGMRELLMCSWRKSKTKSSTNSSMHHKRTALQTHSLPTDTTHIGNEQL
uniref:G-protein coupled receptors family 1 profile domain-containing protein n=1 Tax=Stomoxys calcitrans TaxID=35570 RepID=A0A1I8Q6N3_STOCA